MSDNIGQLKTEVKALEAEIEALQLEIDKLRERRSSFRVAVSFPKNNSPEALAQFQRQKAKEVARWSEELEEINQTLKALEEQLAQKQAELAPKASQLQWQELEEGIHEGGQRLQEQVTKINELADGLNAEISTLKQIYREVNPLYCQWLQKSVKVVEFKGKTIPYVFVKKDGFILGNKKIEGDGQG
ncbi:MAG: hypothetical protein SXA11_05280 [Cyanobacteriota bacterium]|nr:hypothetical protein [Cyanobacteriota bacterium]